MFRTVLIVLVGLGIVTSSASAYAPVAWQRKALSTAEKTWGPQTCGALRLQWGNPADFGGSDLWAEWAWADNCNIGMPSERAWLGYPDFCTAVLHGAGHVRGLGHSTRGIMKAERQVVRTEAEINGKEYVRWGDVDRRCLPIRT